MPIVVDMNPNISKKYIGIRDKSILFQMEDEYVVVSMDVWKKLITTTYLFEGYLDKHKDTEHAYFYHKWVGEVYRREFGWNWFQKKPENIRALLVKTGIIGMWPRGRWFYEKFAKLLVRVRFLPGPPNYN